MIRYIKINKAVWCNHNIISYIDFTDNSRIYTNRQLLPILGTPALSPLFSLPIVHPLCKLTLSPIITSDATVILYGCPKYNPFSIVADSEISKPYF